MLRISLSILGLALFLATAGAHAYAPAWQCDSRLELAGDRGHFLRYGRDSWSGLSTLRCYSGPQVTEEVVAVTFNSLDFGFGADENSGLEMDVSLLTRVDPTRLQMRSLVAGSEQDGWLTWLVDSALSEASILVRVPSRQALSSLSRGTLYLRRPETP